MQDIAVRRRCGELPGKLGGHERYRARLGDVAHRVLGLCRWWERAVVLEHEYTGLPSEVVSRSQWKTLDELRGHHHASLREGGGPDVLKAVLSGEREKRNVLLSHRGCGLDLPTGEKEGNRNGVVDVSLVFIRV